MTKVDQFESVFRAAAKPVFEFSRVRIQKVLVVTDLEKDAAIDLGERIQVFLSVLKDEPELDWRFADRADTADVGKLLELVERESPDLICTYRHLQSDGWKWPHSLGEELDLLTQATPHPVLVIPRPDAGHALDHALENTDRVMAITDHLTGDHRLVNFAHRFLEPEGMLFLTHIEDELAFERVMEAIAKIPEIDTETARVEIKKRLLADPHDYITSCRKVLEGRDRAARIEELITTGHRLSDYRALIEQHEVDLLVFNTKDEDQFAMHGLAYPLAVELRQIPLLML